MYGAFELKELPQITQIYSVRRRTVWQIADRNSLLIFVTEGKCRIEFENKVYVLCAGDMFFVPAGYSYTRRPIDNIMCTLYYAHIKMENSPILLDRSAAVENIKDRLKNHENSLNFKRDESQSSDTLLLSVFTSQPKDKDKILTLWNDALGYNLKNKLESPISTSLCICQILAIISAITTKELMALAKIGAAPLPPAVGKLKNAIAYIRQHIKENISLDDLAEVCNITKQHLIRTFKKELGKTPTAYINEYKISLAKDMIFNSPQLSVKEISAEMGFEDQHYFTRLFTKVAGMSPTAYKLRLKNFDPDKQMD